MFDIDISQALRTLSVAAVPALLGIILHEVAHGWAALRCGDPTAKFLGRLTLNPLPHIDPAGLLVFGLTSLSGSFVFGWAPSRPDVTPPAAQNRPFPPKTRTLHEYPPAHSFRHAAHR